MGNEENQITWRARNKLMHADGVLSYPAIGCLRPAISASSIKIAPKVKFICTKMQRFCPWFELHHPNMEEYCSRYGYEYVKDLDYTSSAARAGYIRTGDTELDRVKERIFGTRRLMIEQLHDCDLLVWLGGDTLITNMRTRLEDIMPVTAHVAMTKSECYECDAIIIRNSPEGKSLLEDWTNWMLSKEHPVWQQYGDFKPPFTIAFKQQFTTTFVAEFEPWHDDDVLTAVCERYPEHAARVHAFDANKRLWAVTHTIWRPGDYILHTPGTDDDDRMRHLLMGLAYIVR